MHMQQQGIQSMRKISTKPELDGRGKIRENLQQHFSVHMVVSEELKRMNATNKTDHFPIVSIKGMKYIIVLYNYNSNAFLAQACRSHIGQELVVDTYNKVYKYVESADMYLLFS